MSLRSFLCSLVLLSSLLGDGVLLETKTAHAQFIGDRPNRGGRRNIEINIHGQAYYGFGWYDRFDNYAPYYNTYAIGPGFSMLFPVVQNGFIPSINNAFYVGFFTDFFDTLGIGSFAVTTTLSRFTTAPAAIVPFWMSVIGGLCGAGQPVPFSAMSLVARGRIL